MNPRMPVLLAALCGAVALNERPGRAAQAGSVTAWGIQAMPVVQPGTRFIAIAGGGDHSLALKTDGTVVAWGGNCYCEGTVPASLSGVIAIAGGGKHSLALKTDGTVVAWGDDSS